MANKNFPVNYFEGDENLIACFRPNKIRYFLLGFLQDFAKFIILPLLIVLIIGFISSGFGASLLDCLIFLVNVGPFIGLCLIGLEIYKSVKYKKICYYVTNKKIYITGSSNNQSAECIPFCDIVSAEISNDFCDKLLGKRTGSINFNLKKDSISSLKENEEEFTFKNVSDPVSIQKVINDYLK